MFLEYGNSPQLLSRKKKRRPENWKRNISKNKRQAGESYIDTKSNMVPAKQIQPSCKHTCFYLCSKQFTEADRNYIFKKFWSLSDDEKKNFYFKFVKRVPINDAELSIRRQRLSRTNLIYK